MNRESALARRQNEEAGKNILKEEIDSPLTGAKIRAISRIISSAPKKESLCDVGCFDGKFFSSYRSSGIASIDGFDVIPEALEIAKSRVEGARTFVWNVEEDPAPVPSECYDIVVCADVIEHIFNTRNLVSECHRIMKQNGRFILLTPNLVSLWNRYLLLRGEMPLGHPGVSVDYRTSHQVNPSHVRIGTAKEWTGLLKSEGFRFMGIDGIWSSVTSKIISLGRPTLSHTLVIECTK